jgi:hypothetical protein
MFILVTGQLTDDARPQQRQEADDREDRQPQLRDHPLALGRGKTISLFLKVLLNPSTLSNYF